MGIFRNGLIGLCIGSLLLLNACGNNGAPIGENKANLNAKYTEPITGSYVYCPYGRLMAFIPATLFGSVKGTVQVCVLETGVKFDNE